MDFPEDDELVLEHYERHYRAWLDEPVPALEGVRPREAARSEALRPALVSLLKDLEQMYSRSLEMGQPGYDPFWMWEELGLLELPEAPRRWKEAGPRAIRVSLKTGIGHVVSPKQISGSPILKTEHSSYEPSPGGACSVYCC